ncbi:MAG: heavy metal translocating P-type ATPase [Bacillota bacterium]
MTKQSKEALPNLQQEFILEGLSCAQCAAKMEQKIKQLDNIREAEINFALKKLVVKIKDEEKQKRTIEQIKQIVTTIETAVELKPHQNQKKEPQVENDFKQLLKKGGLKIGLGAVIFALTLIGQFRFEVELLLFVTAYLILGWSVIKQAVVNLANREVFDENFLMVIATLGAFAIQEYPEAVAVMLFYQLGELLQELAVNRSRQSITELMEIKADYANLKVNGEIKQVSPDQVEIGDQIIIKPGERVPVDGEIISGESLVDTSALTGESQPRRVSPQDEILSGSINQSGSLTVRVTEEFSNSTVARILDLVEHANAKKAPTEQFITKFARYYTPLVVLGALIVAVVPPLLITGASFSEWFYRGLIFLVISCPCALLISIPLGFFGGIGAASKRGVLIKGGNYLEALNNLAAVVFDKTGTLTKGEFEVSEIVVVNGYTEDQILALAAQAEAHSTHPIAESILAAYHSKVDSTQIEEYRELSGQGIKAEINGQEVLVGNDRLLSSHGVDYSRPDSQAGTIVNVVVDGEYCGYILIEDQLKEDAQSAISNLTELGVREVSMLTGDNQQTADYVAQELGLDNYYAELLPDQKVEQLEKILANHERKVAFVGDGINDAPVLARADIGVAMGGLGSDAAIEAADVVLMTDEPNQLARAVEVARETRKIVWQNILITLGVKGAVLSLGALGMATMWEAIFADVGVALLAVLNSVRIIRNN